jgi:hypothetical protein
LLLTACNHKNTTDNKNVDLLSPASGLIEKLSEIASDIDYIPLQTSDSSLIRRIFSLKATDYYYYINSSSKILCFNHDGQFSFSLDKTGCGPEEYQFISDFDVSTDNKLLVIKANNELVFYSVEDRMVDFIKKFPVNPAPASINFTAGNNILLQYSNEDGIKPFSRILINLKGDTIYKRPNYLRFTSKDGMITYSIYENIRYYYNGSLLTKELQNDTLFRFDVDKSALAPYMVFATRGKGLTPTARAEGIYLSDHLNEFLQVQKIFESDRILWYSTYYLDEGGNFIYEKGSGKKFSVDNKSLLTDDLAGGPAFEPKYCYKGMFVDWLDALTLKKHFSGESLKVKEVINSDKEKYLRILVNSLEETDNPVLVVVTLKK